MAPRKRAFSEVDAPEAPKEMGLLDRLRNMWEFAAVMQYISTFGDVLKIDKEFDINDFEDECMKPEPSDKLEDLGLYLLKWISSHRGLTLEIWDEYTRRQYQAKAPTKNPYGEDETPKKFREFDTFTKIRVLHQLTVWTFWNPDRMRERMPEQTEAAQSVEWRIIEFGWDKDDRTYYLLDDNRLYRRTDPPIPDDSSWKPKANTLKAKAAARANRKRRRTRADGSADIADDDDESKLVEADAENNTPSTKEDNGFGWECVCATTQQYRDFIDAHRKTRDANEKELVIRIQEDVMPHLEKQEEAQQRKVQKRERELLAMEKLATAKRSSRLAGKHEQERIAREQAETEAKRAKDLAAARRMEEEQQKMDEERRSRMLTREQRIREREYKRILHEEELARMEEEERRIESGETRGSRHLKANIEQTKKELDELENDDEWMFDCAGCGAHGKNFDDGSHSIQCEKCNTWQHSKCYGVSQSEAESDDFHFVCKDCIRREEDAKKPKIAPLKFRVGPSSSPPAESSTIEVQKKRGRPSKTQSPAAESSPRFAPPDSVQPFQGPSTNGFTSPKQFPPPQKLEPSPSPVKPSPYMNGLYQSSPLQPQPASTANGHGFYGQMSPPPQLSPYGQSFPRPTPGQQGLPVPANSTPYQQRPSSSQSNQAVAATPASARTMPSPLHNRPSMSPTQGNPEVGLLAGIPSPKPATSSISPSPIPSTPLQNLPQTANGNTHAASQHQAPSQSPPPNAGLSTPLVNHMSGRSPTKQSPPPPSFSEQTPRATNSNIPSGSFGQSSIRTVSGTPIFPPSSTLAPSPKQLDKTPVPTPHKQMTPLNLGQSEIYPAGETAEMLRERIAQQEEQARERLANEEDLAAQASQVSDVNDGIA